MSGAGCLLWFVSRFLRYGFARRLIRIKSLAVLATRAGIAVQAGPAPGSLWPPVSSGFTPHSQISRIPDAEVR